MKKHQEEIFNVNYENIKRVFFSTEDCFVLVDGLALVLEACLNQHTKWAKNGCSMYLHAIYHVERTLRMFFRLKSNIKLVFFNDIGSLIERCEMQAQRDYLNLLYHLVVFHLKSCEVLKDRLIFFAGIDEYKNSLKNDRIICYMGFSYVDTKLIPNTELAQQLRLHYISLIRDNLDLGIYVILTKNFWYDSDSAKGYIITSKRNREAFKDEMNATLYNRPTDEVEEEISTNFDLSRQSIYSKAIEQMSDQSMQYLFQLHLKMLEHVSLEKRASIELVDVAKLEQEYPKLHGIIQMFKFNMAKLLRAVNRTNEFIKLSPTCGAQIADLFDSRLFWRTYERLCESNEQISGAIFQGGAIYSTDKRDISQSNQQLVIGKPIKTSHRHINNELFNKFLQEFCWYSNPESTSNKNNKVVVDQSGLDEYRNMISLMKKNNQFQATKFASYLENYAKSFRFNYSEPSIFEFISNQMEKPESADVLSSSKRKVATKKADVIILKNKEQKYADAEKKDKNVLASVENMFTLENNNFQKLNSFVLTSLNVCKTYEVKLEVFKIYLELLLKQFGIAKSVCDRRALSLEYYKACESSLRGFKGLTVRNGLLTQFEKNFKDILAKIEYETTENHRLDFINFQMSCAQFYLHRETFSQEDSRVDDFKPDPWQIQLMDAIDKRKTVIVSAPTSSGKTFASFYAIKFLLQSSDDDVAIYVAPTKALVNQMLAGVYSRFKNFELAKNKQLVGVFTREHQENVFDSRVLLTVPECLEILYFSPDSKSLLKRVKYVIFDEFQMINDDERGKVWERIVLMCECPFLAMSATIENPAMLRVWLAESRAKLASSSTSNQAAQNVFKNTFAFSYDELFSEDNLRLDLNANCTPAMLASFAQFESVLINCNNKFNSVLKRHSLRDKLAEIQSILANMRDPEKLAIINRLNLELNDVILIDVKQASTDFVYLTYAYNGDKTYEFDISLANRKESFELLKLEEPVLRKFSPLNSLNEECKNIRNILEAISLTPRDTHRLNQALSKTYSHACIDDVSLHLNEKYFINRNDVKQLETELKSKFMENFNSSNENDRKCYKQLVEDLRRDSNFVQVPFKTESDLPILVEYLEQNNMLPCLAFSFTRSSCEHYVEVLLDYYERKEAYLRGTKYAKIIELLEAKRARESAALKKSRDKEDKKSTNREADNVEDRETTIDDYSLLDEYLPECVLNERRMYSKVEVEEQLSKAFDGELNDWRCRAILRGFAFHHAGINSKKRVCIESFFRNKFIKLVFCTSTLAQGIHVPCKTVIFFEDSIFLNAGLFKQCAGRAGRRGFDTCGSVVFINIPEVKCKQLVSSKPAEIHASYIISPTFVLKLFNLVSNSSDSDRESSLKSALRVLENGLMLHQNKVDYLEIINKYYFMFCTEFLLRNSLLSFDGRPIGLHKFVSYFGYHEPSNLAMAHIISSWNDGDFKDYNDEQLETCIIVLLSYLFNRRDIYDAETVEKIRRENTWNSKVVLEDLNEIFQRKIDKYNQYTHNVFERNLIEQSKLFNQDLDYNLPLSGYNYMKVEEPIQEIEKFLKVDLTVELKMISKFAALSGIKDDFKIKDKSILVHMKSFYLDFKDLYPTIEFNQDFYGNRIYLNSYLLDFYNHECYKSIINENGLRDETAYGYLYDFRKILQSLSELTKSLGSKRFCRAIKSINEKYIEKFEKTDFDSTNRFHYKKTNNINKKK